MIYLFVTLKQYSTTHTHKSNKGHKNAKISTKKETWLYIITYHIII